MAMPIHRIVFRINAMDGHFRAHVDSRTVSSFALSLSVSLHWPFLFCLLPAPRCLCMCARPCLLSLPRSRCAGCITEAILVHGQPCPQDYIIDFVEARWSSLKHKDGASQFADARTATLEQLYADSNLPSSASSRHALFEPCKAKPGRWKLVSVVAKPKSVLGTAALMATSSATPPPRPARPFFDDENSQEDTSSEPGSRRGGLNFSSSSVPRDSFGAASASGLNGLAQDSSGSASFASASRIRTRRTKRKRPEDFESTFSSDDDGVPVELPGGRDAAYLLDLPRKKPKVYTLEELSYDASMIPPEELLERVKDSKLTNLQILISISIIRSPNYEAHLDYILNFVCQHYTYLLGRDGNPKATDPKRAVLASLSKNASSSPLFVKVGDVWKIGPKNVLYGLREVIPGLMEYITVSKLPGDAIELTELQKMIMRAISLEGGTCGLEKIYEYVKPRYDRLKRRDGSSYATNARRAIQASLSNNSSNRPIFQLVGTNSDEETLWALTERGQESLDMINSNEPEPPSYDEDSLEEESSAASNSNKPSSSSSAGVDTSTTSAQMDLSHHGGDEHMSSTLPQSTGAATVSHSATAAVVATDSGSVQIASRNSSFMDSESTLSSSPSNHGGSSSQYFHHLQLHHGMNKMDSGSLSPSSATDGQASDSEDEVKGPSHNSPSSNPLHTGHVLPLAF